jgi:hypothetical protein
MLMLVGCTYNTGFFTSAKPTATPEDMPLFIVTYTGGLCPYGPCHKDIHLYRTGKYVISDGSGKQSQVVVETVRIAQLDATLEQTDFTTVAVPSTSPVCPSAYDGQDITYTFYPKMGSVTIPCNASVGTSVQTLITEVQMLLSIYGTTP